MKMAKYSRASNGAQRSLLMDKTTGHDMHKLPVLLILATSALLSACSSADFYAMRQENAQDTCRKLPEADRGACLARNSADYDSYKKQREGLLDSSKK
ncbi:hypothetical protein ACO0LO_05315 [Undibacterium sp. TJN25]|uniref:hypothetical protein n=1 Tax=Undibacterium sp. TJN25 TaxID=3413056 RepID=UPI003BF40DFF